MSSRPALLEGVLPRLVPTLPRHLIPPLAKALDKHLQLLEATITIIPTLSDNKAHTDQALLDAIQLFLPSAAALASRDLFNINDNSTRKPDNIILQAIKPNIKQQEGNAAEDAKSSSDTLAETKKSTPSTQKKTVVFADQVPKSSTEALLGRPKSFGSYINRQLNRPRSRVLGEEDSDLCEKLETMSLASGASEASGYSITSMPNFAHNRISRNRYSSGGSRTKKSGVLKGADQGGIKTRLRSSKKEKEVVSPEAVSTDGISSDTAVEKKVVPTSRRHTIGVPVPVDPIFLADCNVIIC
jgi:hypothetical protein